MKFVPMCLFVAVAIFVFASPSFAAPLIEAISRGDLAGVVASAKKESVNEKDGMGSTALHEAAYRGYADIANYLLGLGAAVNVENNPGLSPLHYATMNYFSRYANLDIVVLLIDKGAAVNAKDKSGNTPIHTPALNCNLDMVRLLIEKGADVNAANGEGKTPLHLASGNGSFECVNLLYDNGADLKARTKDGKTASDLARENGHTELADALNKVMKKH